MEKKTKSRITSALAVLVITLFLGTAISIATNENGAQTPALVQPEIKGQQFGALSTETSCLVTAKGILKVSSPATIYESIDKTPPFSTMLTTITCTHGIMQVEVISDDKTYEYEFGYGNSVTIYGRPTKIVVSGKGWTSGHYELVGIINPEPPP